MDEKDFLMIVELFNKKVLQKNMVNSENRADDDIADEEENFEDDDVDDDIADNESDLEDDDDIADNDENFEDDDVDGDIADKKRIWKMTLQTKRIYRLLEKDCLQK